MYTHWKEIGVDFGQWTFVFWWVYLIDTFRTFYIFIGIFHSNFSININNKQAKLWYSTDYHAANSDLIVKFNNKICIVWFSTHLIFFFLLAKSSGRNLFIFTLFVVVFWKIFSNFVTCIHSAGNLRDIAYHLIASNYFEQSVEIVVFFSFI